MAKQTVVYALPRMAEVAVRRDLAYRVTAAGPLAMDVYYPPDGERAPTPAVVFVLGISDPAIEAARGFKLKDTGVYRSWAQLAAASGLIAITYTNREPAADARALLGHVRKHAESLGIDANRIGLWACSGNVPVALSLLMEPASHFLKFGVLCYGFMLDLDGSRRVGESAKTLMFEHPNAGKSVDDLPQTLPLFVARAGSDHFPHLNESIDAFMRHALRRNLPVTFVNHPDGPHAFDVYHDSEATREIIRQILAFMRFRLLG
jgi:acetyl esterase/lipase